MSFDVETRVYSACTHAWPKEGRHILASFDDSSVVVYQAFRPAIAEYALDHQRFGGPFSFTRMTWLKPGFLWMMYRSGWAQKAGQEFVLAIHVPRAFFDSLLREAVESGFDSSIHASRKAWKQSIQQSDVRLQWDPDHGPSGHKESRRAIQLGIRRKMVKRYVAETLRIDDATGFVREQRQSIRDLGRLSVPAERVYPVSDETIRAKLQLAPWTGPTDGSGTTGRHPRELVSEPKADHGGG